MVLEQLDIHMQEKKEEEESKQRPYTYHKN